MLADRGERMSFPTMYTATALHAEDGTELSPIRTFHKVYKKEDVDRLVQALERKLADKGIDAVEGKLDAALPVVLYFPDDASREEFITMINMAKPNFVARKVK